MVNDHWSFYCKNCNKHHCVHVEQNQNQIPANPVNLICLSSQFFIYFDVEIEPETDMAIQVNINRQPN